MPDYAQGNPYNSEGSIEIISSNLESIEAGIANVQLPALVWKDVIPAEAIDTSVSAGATFASYLVRDRRGAGSFRARGSNNVPTVGSVIDKTSIPLEPSGVSAIFDRQDKRQWELAHSIEIFTDLGEIMAEAQERHIEGTFFFGNAPVNYAGFLNDSTIPTTTAAVNAGGTSTAWVDKSPSEIIFDMTTALGTVWSGSRTLFMADTIALPVDQLNLIISTPVGQIGLTDTIYNFIANNNVYTKRTGNPLRIMDIRYLEGAGAGGTDRMRLFNSDPRNWKMPMPLPFNLLTPVYQGFQTELVAEYIFGPPHIRQPLSQLNVDGI